MEEVKEEKKILDASRRTTLLYSTVVPMEIEKKMDAGPLDHNEFLTKC